MRLPSAVRAFVQARLRDPAFQRRASRFPLTRPIARAQAGELFDLVAGFVYSAVLAAVVELDVLPMLAAGPLSPEMVAARAGLSPKAATRLLRAAAAIGLARDSGGGYALGDRGAALLGNPGAVAMVRHHAVLFRDLADPVGLLRRGRGQLGGFWDYAGADPTRAAAYSELMAASQPLVAAQLLDSYRLARHRALLDVGGGTGAFLVAAAARCPRLQLMLFDRPSVAEAARAALDVAGLSARSSVFAGDMFRDSLPVGADVILLNRVLHDHDDGRALDLLRRVRAALPARGRLLILEPMAGTPGAEASGDAYFGFYLLAMGQGRPRCPAEIVAMARAAGFRSARLRPTPLPLIARLIVADT